MSILVVSDLHIRDPEQSGASLEHAEWVARRLEAVARRAPEAELCVLLGDLADEGQEGAYAWLKPRVDALPWPTVAMLGNHDDREVFRQVWTGAMDQSGFVQGEVLIDGMHLLFLDTNKPGAIEGELCEVRLAWLGERLAAAGDAPVLIFMHHPPFDIGDPDLDPVKLESPDAFADLVRGAGNVRHIFFAHVHRAMSLTWQGIPCSCVDGLGVPDRPGHPSEPPLASLTLRDGAPVIRFLGLAVKSQ